MIYFFVLEKKNERPDLVDVIFFAGTVSCCDIHICDRISIPVRLSLDHDKRKPKGRKTKNNPEQTRNESNHKKLFRMKLSSADTG